MNQQQTMSQAEGWTGLLNSLIGLTSAATLFSIQQFQNAFTMMTDSRDGMNRFTRAINSVSKAMTSEVDEPKRSTAEEWGRSASRVVRSMTPGASEDFEDAMSGRKR